MLHKPFILLHLASEIERIAIYSQQNGRPERNPCAYWNKWLWRKIWWRWRGVTYQPVLTLAQFCKECRTPCRVTCNMRGSWGCGESMLREFQLQYPSRQPSGFHNWCLDRIATKIPFSDPASFDKAYSGTIRNNTSQNPAISRRKQTTKHWRAPSWVLRATIPSWLTATISRQQMRHKTDRLWMKFRH